MIISQGYVDITADSSISYILTPNPDKDVAIMFDLKTFNSDKTYLEQMYNKVFKWFPRSIITTNAMDERDIHTKTLHVPGLTFVGLSNQISPTSNKVIYDFSLLKNSSTSHYSTVFIRQKEMSNLSYLIFEKSSTTYILPKL